jgi:hypothetical protein
MQARIAPGLATKVALFSAAGTATVAIISVVVKPIVTDYVIVLLAAKQKRQARSLPLTPKKSDYFPTAFSLLPSRDL